MIISQIELYELITNSCWCEHAKIREEERYELCRVMAKAQHVHSRHACLSGLFQVAYDTSGCSAPGTTGSHDRKWDVGSYLAVYSPSRGSQSSQRPGTAAQSPRASALWAGHAGPTGRAAQTVHFTHHSSPPDVCATCDSLLERSWVLTCW